MARWESDDDVEAATKTLRTSVFSFDSVVSEGAPSLRGVLRSILESQRFDLAMGAVVVANSATIGFEQMLRLHGGDRSAIDIFEHCFLFIYVVELLMNLIVRRWKSFQSPWLRFDMLIVSISVLTQWIWVPAVGDLEGVGFIMVLRTARLLRLARTLRLLLRFKELWMLAQGLISSAATMVYTTFLLVVILYIFSCIGIELITLNPKAIGPEPDERFQTLVADHFSSLGGTMLTLFAFISFDNIVTIYKPLIELDWTLLPYFSLLILVVGIVLANLVTAVIVNSALEQAQQDKALVKAVEESKKKKVVKDLRKIFQRLDTDASGKVSAEEIKEVDPEDLARLADFMTIQDPVEIFNALDVDQSGEIDLDEFCDGIWEVVVSNAPLEVKRMEKQVDKMQSVVKHIQQNQSLMQHQLSEVLKLLGHGGSSDGYSVGPQHFQSSADTQDRFHMADGQAPRESMSGRHWDVSVPDSPTGNLTLKTHRLSPDVAKVIVEPARLGRQAQPYLGEEPHVEANANRDQRGKEVSCSTDCSGGEHPWEDADMYQADTMDLASYVELKVLSSLTSCREIDVLFELCDARVDAALSGALEKMQHTPFAGLQSSEQSGRCAGEFQSMLQRALADVVPAEGHNDIPAPRYKLASMEAPRPPRARGDLPRIMGLLATDSAAGCSHRCV